MYVIDKEDHMLRYSFTPGWFDEIEVKSITVKWNNQNVLKSNSSTAPVDGYLVWTDSLSYGEKLNTSVYYNLDTFEVTEEGQVQEDEVDGGIIAIIIIIAIVFVGLIIFLIIMLFDDYDSHSGFGGGSRTYIYGGGRSSCACVSSCACACACAGGGRAGCSKKDFYHTNVQTDILTKVLEEE
jgi:hypothetical protein